MSRLGNLPVAIPKGVDVNIKDSDIQIKGPKGQLNVSAHPNLKIEKDGDEIKVSRQNNNRFNRSQHGLIRALINNSIIGVTQGYSRNLEIHGVGYRCALKGKNLELSLGFSHPVVFEPPQGIAFTVTDQTKITVSGIDKQLVGQVCANLRRLRPPDSYQGKGVRYEGEQLKLKPGKTAA